MLKDKDPTTVALVDASIDFAIGFVGWLLCIYFGLTFAEPNLIFFGYFLLVLSGVLAIFIYFWDIRHPRNTNKSP